MILDNSQTAAAELICTAAFGVVTGGPGTGKTTTLRRALDQMDLRGESYALAAPTGKAAKRMSEATGRDASTIHRLLEYKPPFGFTRNARRPLEVSAVVIDESSMVDVELGASLLDACAPETRVIFIGDANQLPSVGPGRVLADLVESNAVPVARLTTVHRAAAESWVCRNAPNVLTGAPLELEPRKDFLRVVVDDAASCAVEVCDLVSRKFPEAQVLIPQRTSACGVDAINKALQQRLNPPREDAPEWKLGDLVFRAGDRVIHTRNNYTLDVFNGEVGEIESVDEREAVVDFGDRVVRYSKGAALDLELAYALTVHKSQGSEFPWVVCVVHSSHTFMLTRQLFYTAITRAKQGVVIVGDAKGLETALSGKAPPKRNTALVDRMRELGVDVAEPAQAEFEESPAPVAAPAKSASAGEALPW